MYLRVAEVICSEADGEEIVRAIAAYPESGDLMQGRHSRISHYLSGLGLLVLTSPKNWFHAAVSLLADGGSLARR
jgi:hypothetical protein